MPRSKEQTRVLSLLLGLGLALTALLFWRQKQVDGFQISTPGSTLGSDPITLTADGILLKTSLKTLSEAYTKMSPSDQDSKKKFKIIDEAAKAVVWETGMSASNSTDSKVYAVLMNESLPISLQQASRDFSSVGTFLGLIKKDGENSYINVLSGSGVVEYSGFRVKLDTTKFYPTVSTSTDTASIIYDPIAKKEIWKSGQTGTLTPDGTKELILYSTKDKKYAKMTDIDALINSDQNKQNADMQIIYPIMNRGTPDDFIDARAVKYESVKYTPQSSNLYMYAGIGIGVVAGAALLFVAVRTFTKSSNTANATVSNSK